MTTPNSRRPRASALRLRARDVDRAAVCDVLDAAYSDGQLSDVEHRHRTEATRSARTLADLDRLVRDLQVHPDLHDAVPTPPSLRDARWAVALSAAVVLVCGIVVVTSARDHDEPATAAATTTELTTAAGLGRMLDEIAHQLGNSEVDQLTVYPEYATFSRPVPSKPGLAQRYEYQVEKGQARITENGTSSNRTEGVPINLAELRPNVPRVIGLLHGADRTLRVDDPTRIHMEAKRGDDGPVVSIHLWNEDAGAQGFLTVGFDGAVRSVYRSDQ
ncbi:hypothetical protein ABIC28_002691 [Rhodococcus sp. PvR044]|jgi:hypothetical protein|uniref:DUF1707 SHOCT-like domain-containing protein n=1 Tax=unclassified Rhodococcus (in: high G+C Gram-positive bacteria) TaxID=192944 RepID=UPI000BCA1C2E|nr:MULTISPECIES: DUF1707 domain-containing protein [unclassified Rhodococcus (in: high G+C Gram-positive bacteria)]MBP1162074.1 hypothetical protein [Rhodococcus sp. PvR099]PTR43217.1 uncharacterized protein DUF1707 [Rhodococcus sp. OK611]SNX91080.1 protein of unknown function [Rhodococcus sp. OK270]